MQDREKTSTSTAFEPFHLDGEPVEVPEKDKVQTALEPILSDPKAWANYNDQNVYIADKAMRAWIKNMRTSSKWVHSYKLRRYSMGMLWEHVLGKTYQQGSKDQKMLYAMRRVASYYSTRIQKNGYINGKRISKSVYTISPKRLNKPPYSLKLRLEWLAEQGRVPSNHNMQVPKDNLCKGQARNPRTQANMDKRAADGRRRFNEYQNKRRQELKEQNGACSEQQQR